MRKVDKSGGKVTLKHAPIPNLGMPDMLMVFRVGDPAMLEQVKAGDKVRFSADKDWRRVHDNSPRTSGLNTAA